MAADPDDLLQRWREAETQYRDIMDHLIDDAAAPTSSTLTKQRVLEVEHVRAAADLQRARYFRRALTVADADRRA